MRVARSVGALLLICGMAPLFSGCVVLLPLLEEERAPGEVPAMADLEVRHFVAETRVPREDQAAQDAAAKVAAAPVAATLVAARRSQQAPAPAEESLDARITLLIKQLATGTDVQRTHAASDLGFLGPQAAAAIEPLAAALRSDSCKWVRRAAAKSLGKIGSRRALPALTAALGDRNKWVAHSAERALQKLGALRTASLQ